MSVQIRLLKSKIHFLNAQIAGFHDSGLFSPEEIAAMQAPILPQIQDLQEEIIRLQQNEDENAGAEALTPEKQEL
ncbi:FlxA-like family protein [Salinimicrobium sp. WS361]|uniref:FlxA-like family protein n=1 Tax=Salinimicrobium sp. WS361 TaxID=3425123 RepID=UPI003D6F42B8